MRGMKRSDAARLYDAYHDILPVQRENHPAQTYDIVGPICETGDFIGRSRELSVAPQALLAVAFCGFVRDEHEFQLQHASACCRGDGGRCICAYGEGARDRRITDAGERTLP